VESVRIWLNRNYATTVHLLNMLRHNEHGIPVTLFSSHVDPSSPMLAASDHRLREPVVTDPDFVDEMLALCLRHDIDVLLPVAGQSLVAHRAADFKTIGTSGSGCRRACRQGIDVSGALRQRLGSAVAGGQHAR